MQGSGLAAKGPGEIPQRMQNSGLAAKGPGEIPQRMQDSGLADFTEMSHEPT